LCLESGPIFRLDGFELFLDDLVDPVDIVAKMPEFPGMSSKSVTGGRRTYMQFFLDSLGNKRWQRYPALRGFFLGAPEDGIGEFDTAHTFSLPHPAAPRKLERDSSGFL
jgi:hypothetical protein